MSTEGSTVMQAVDGTTLRSQSFAMAKPKRRPLRPETVLVLLVLANAGAILLAACLAAASG